jgi:hypothetical protein
VNEPIVERPSMSAYGVPDDLDGVLPWSWAQSRLVANRNFWVVSVSPDQRPHAMPVWGVWLEQAQEFWFSCAPGARKARNLRANPRVTIATSDTVEVVTIEGRAREANDDPGESAAIDVYTAKYWPPDQAGPMGDFLRSNALFAVTPERGFGIVEHEEEFARRATRWRWE